MQVQSLEVELSRELVATAILNNECSKSTSTLFKVSFFLVHLFYSSSFGLINSIKGIGNSTIISLTDFCEFDDIGLNQCSQSKTWQLNERSRSLNHSKL